MNFMLDGDGSAAFIPIEDRIYRFDLNHPNQPEELFRLPKRCQRVADYTAW